MDCPKPDELPKTTNVMDQRYSSGQESVPLITKVAERSFEKLRHAQFPRETIFTGKFCPVTLEFEFLFLSGKAMAGCVGVGIDYGHVMLNQDLEIMIVGGNAHTWEEMWRRVLSSSELVLKIQLGPELEEQQMEKFEAEHFTRIYGVACDKAAIFVEDSSQSQEVIRPLLFEMARYVAQHATPMDASTSRGTGFVAGQKHTMMMKLGNSFSFNKRGRGGGGDGDGDGEASQQQRENTASTILRVTVYPGPGGVLYDSSDRAVDKPDTLVRVSIEPIFKIELQCTSGVKKIAIECTTTYEIATSPSLRADTTHFRWYHNDVGLSLQPANGEERAAVLEPGYGILNEVETCKVTLSRTSTSTISRKAQASCQGGVNFNLTGIGGIQSHGDSQTSTDNGDALANAETSEICLKQICGGFLYCNVSSMAEALVCFELTCPLSNANIWESKNPLQGQGMFSSIEPVIKGVWLPLDSKEASPYLFKAERRLNGICQKPAGEGEVEETVFTLLQIYNVPFYINHAMTHLKQADQHGE